MLKSSVILFRSIFGLITFRFAYGRTSNSAALWFRDFRTWPRLPKPTIFIFGDPRILQTIQEKSQFISGNYYFYIFDNVGHRNLTKCWKRRAPTNPEDLSNKFLKSLDMRWIFTKNMKWTCCDMGSLNLWNFEILKLWNQETKKPRNQETKKLWNQETKKPRNLFYFQGRESSNIK